MLEAGSAEARKRGSIIVGLCPILNMQHGPPQSILQGSRQTNPSEARSQEARKRGSIIAGLCPESVGWSVGWLVGCVVGLMMDRG